MRFILYMIRWWISAIVMTPFMIILSKKIPLIPNLFIGQTIGAIIFYNIDKCIFRGKIK